MTVLFTWITTLGGAFGCVGVSSESGLLLRLGMNCKSILILFWLDSITILLLWTTVWIVSLMFAYVAGDMCQVLFPLKSLAYPFLDQFICFLYHGVKVALCRNVIRSFTQKASDLGYGISFIQITCITMGPLIMALLGQVSYFSTTFAYSRSCQNILLDFNINLW